MHLQLGSPSSLLSQTSAIDLASQAEMCDINRIGRPLLTRE